LKSKLIVTPPLKWDVLGAGTSSHYQKFSQNTTNLDFYYDKDLATSYLKIIGDISRPKKNEKCIALISAFNYNPSCQLSNLIFEIKKVLF